VGYCGHSAKENEKNVSSDQSGRPLDARVAFIVGASSGMGRATAIRFAEMGAKVAVAARQTALLDELTAGLHSAGANAMVFPLDVRDRPAIDAAVARIGAEWGRLDIVVYATGTNTRERALDRLTPEGWSELLDVNLTGAFHVTQAVLPAMRAAGDGLIIYLSSNAANRPDVSGVAYQASKRGMVGLAHGVMEEERRRGIRTTVIFPGLTDTPLLAKRPTPTPPEIVAKALQPADVAEACAFVAALPARAHVPELILVPSGL
jgi:NADP-dependent 3-hydroxy acid dehydrogenase YdfG